MKKICIRWRVGERVLEVRGEYLPLVELWKVFEVDGAKTEATQGIVVILQSAGRRYALLVDQLIGQHQVVVKNLESNYAKCQVFLPPLFWVTVAWR